MTRLALLLSALCVCLSIAPAHGQGAPQRDPESTQAHFVITKDSEADFRRLMELIRNGALGADVQQANIDVADGTVELELLRKSSPHMVLRLRRRTTSTGFSRQFDIEALENASAGDLARVGQLLDEVFVSSPFQDVQKRNVVAPGGVQSALWSRLEEPASFPYTIGVIVLILFGMLASIVVLCMPPPR